MTDKNKRAMEIVHSGDLYNSGDPDILQVQHSRLRYMEEYNQTRTSDADYAAREALLQKMFAAVGQGCYLEPPVHANWGGYNVSLGDHVYANFNLTLVDDGRIEIGSYVMIGPNVTITSGAHPISPALRDHDVQYNLPVIIESPQEASLSAIPAGSSGRSQKRMTASSTTAVPSRRKSLISICDYRTLSPDSDTGLQQVHCSPSVVQTCIKTILY